MIGAAFARQRLGPGRMNAFSHRNYRLFFVGQLISLVGTWMQQVAQAWLVLELTGDPVWLGIVATAQVAPVLVIGLFAGVVADVFPKRRVLILTQVSMMVLATVLAVLALAGAVEVWMIMVLALLLGTAQAIDMPVRQSFVVELVGREDVGNAVALNSAMFNGARVLGPAAAGLAIGAFGVAVAFTLNAISFLAVIVGLALMDDRKLHVGARVARPESPRAVVANLAEGIGYVRRTPIVLLAVVVVGTVATAGMNFNVLMPAFARIELRSDAAGYGFLMAASGVGALLAALSLALGGRPQPIRLATGSVIMGVASVALAVGRVFPVELVLMVIVGYGSILMSATGNTTIQLAVPDHLRGRVMAVYTTAFSASTPIGGLSMGAIASAVGTPFAIGLGGALSLLIGVWAMAWGRRHGYAIPDGHPSAAGGITATGTARPR